MIKEAAIRHEADIVLIDVGPSLGAINRAALVASSYVVMPVAPDLFSLQGLKNLGPTLRQWRATWERTRAQVPATLGDMPASRMAPAGYVLMQHAERLGRPTKAKWQQCLPIAYRESVLGDDLPERMPEPDPHLIQRIKQYRSLMPLAMEARKPMFALKPADGAIGAHQANVVQCRKDFTGLVQRLVERTGIKRPS